MQFNLYSDYKLVANRHQPDINALILLTSYFYVSVSVLVSYQNEFEDEHIQALLSKALATYATLDKVQRNRFCKQVEQFISLIAENKDIF
ncbi:MULTISPECIES: DNA-binding protein [Bacillus cereus group]|uniref:DNA-binding protein n=1 Tax=Bacillus cereus group TaxID=86661 RepID=UPI000D81DA5D|nr:DNA-binding protein [Bacillus cereus]SPT76267.1 prophage LambdaBa04, DNA-binding protein [Bacillus cereus]